jgi:hypothetical protein
MKDTPIEERTLQSIRDEYAGHILQEFVAEGGKGLKSALWSAMITAIQWKLAHDAADENKVKMIENKVKMIENKGKKRTP